MLITSQHSLTLLEYPIIQRVRAILLTPDNHLLVIKRIKPHNPQAYHVAPGGGVEPHDADIEAALHRELLEELGATIDILGKAFVLPHHIAGKNLEEHFFICRLLDYDLSLRYGPEFTDPSRGEFIPEEIPLTLDAINALNLRTPQLYNWLIDNLCALLDIAA